MQTIIPGLKDGQAHDTLSFNYVPPAPQVVAPKTKVVQKPKIEKADDGVLPAEKVDDTLAQTQEVVLDAHVGESAPQANSPLANYLWEVRKTIDKNKFYPVIAKRLNHQGIVNAVFVIDRSGQVVSIESVEGRYETLSKATKDLLSKQAFPTFPSELQASRLKVNVPIRFTLQ